MIFLSAESTLWRSDSQISSPWSVQHCVSPQKTSIFQASLTSPTNSLKLPLLISGDPSDGSWKI